MLFSEYVFSYILLNCLLVMVFYLYSLIIMTLCRFEMSTDQIMMLAEVVLVKEGHQIVVVSQLHPLLEGGPDVSR